MEEKQFIIDRGLQEYIQAPLENPDDSLISSLICWSSDLDDDDVEQMDTTEVDFDRQPFNDVDEALQQENLTAAKEMMIPSVQVERAVKRTSNGQSNLPEVCSPRKPKSKSAKPSGNAAIAAMRSSRSFHLACKELWRPSTVRTRLMRERISRSVH